ncbi:hypothetical protein L2E82_45676 [Cichorium intybus]|uniref:Uncharacterized protein n=1 Tax=Cichorium intybus TaxID=13427 RepID=A0ACB8ZTY8_CICIN|nr:hypothetical protein L2E82_45676 [Cichorium intybus]
MHHHPQSNSAYNQSTAIKLLDSYHHRCTLLSSSHYYEILHHQSNPIGASPGPESIADHMYRMGLMALIASDTPVSKQQRLLWLNLISFPSSSRCIKMAIVHDIAEAEEIYELWMEYEENSTNEAKVVKDFDKVEMILQALECEKDKFSGVSIGGCV